MTIQSLNLVYTAKLQGASVQEGSDGNNGIVKGPTEIALNILPQSKVIPKNENHVNNLVN